jgi:hypothetical protein
MAPRRHDIVISEADEQVATEMKTTTWYLAVHWEVVVQAIIDRIRASNHLP